MGRFRGRILLVGQRFLDVPQEVAPGRLGRRAGGLIRSVARPSAGMCGSREPHTRSSRARSSRARANVSTSDDAPSRAEWIVVG